MDSVHLHCVSCSNLAELKPTRPVRDERSILHGHDVNKALKKKTPSVYNFIEYKGSLYIGPPTRPMDDIYKERQHTGAMHAAPQAEMIFKTQY